MTLHPLLVVKLKEFDKLFVFEDMNGDCSCNKYEVKSFLSETFSLAYQTGQVDTMKGLQKEWRYRRELYLPSELKDCVDNLVGGVTQASQ